MPSRGDPSDSFSTLSDIVDSFSKQEKKPEKAPVWEARIIEGKRYVSLNQVLELLEMNDVLPGVQKGLKRRLND